MFCFRRHPFAVIGQMRFDRLADLRHRAVPGSFPGFLSSTTPRSSLEIITNRSGLVIVRCLGHVEFGSSFVPTAIDAFMQVRMVRPIMLFAVTPTHRARESRGEACSGRPAEIHQGSAITHRDQRDGSGLLGSSCTKNVTLTTSPSRRMLFLSALLLNTSSIARLWSNTWASKRMKPFFRAMRTRCFMSRLAMPRR